MLKGQWLAAGFYMTDVHLCCLLQSVQRFIDWEQQPGQAMGHEGDGRPTGTGEGGQGSLYRRALAAGLTGEP